MRRRRPGARLRLPGRDRDTSCTARPASACSTAGGPARGDAAVPRRRRHDRVSVSFEGSTWNVLPYKFEAGTPHMAGADRAARGARLHRLRSASTAIAAHEAQLLAYATAGARRDCRRPPDRNGAPEGQHPVVRDGRRAPARHRHHRRPRRGGDPHRPPLRAAGHGALRRAGDGPRLAGDVQHAATRSMRWPARCARCVRCSPDVGALRPLPGGDPRPQPAAEELSRARRREPHRRGLQPAVRRSADVVSEADRGDDRGRFVRGRRLRHLEGVGLDDDRRAQGADGRGSQRAVRAVSPHGHHAARSGGRGHGQAVVARRRARVPGPREVREPGVAHAEGGDDQQEPRRRPSSREADPGR